MRKLGEEEFICIIKATSELCYFSEYFSICEEDHFCKTPIRPKYYDTQKSTMTELEKKKDVETLTILTGIRMVGEKIETKEVSIETICILSARTIPEKEQLGKYENIKYIYT